jgi:hypothetical protein
MRKHLSVPLGRSDGRVAVRLLAIAAAVVTACSSLSPNASSEPSIAVASPPASPTPTPTPRPLVDVRSVGVFGSSVTASGDFSGPGKSEIALLQDPTANGALKVTVRDANADGETFSESTWLTLGPRSFSLTRAKFAVADVTFDGKDDLVALYDAAENRSKLVVFKSTGTAFMPPEQWWIGEDYLWSRARYVMAGKFAANDRDAVLVAYQNPDFNMRIHYFDSTGTAFTFGGTQGVYDSAPEQVDLSRVRFVVGRFTRSGGGQQLAALYQYPNERVRLNVFDPSPKGLVLQSNVFETAEGEYDLVRASVVAADVTGDAKDDLVSLYGDADGSAHVQVFDSGAGFRPSNSWAGWASLPAGSTCAGGTALVVGDWNGDRRVDALELTPTDGVAARSAVLRNVGGSFRVAAATNEQTLCPRWPLTGMPLAGGSATKRPLYVKIDNNPTARPHYGISKADQVYEWLVEGLTTRLAAVFQSRDPDVIGSVRSVRMTDLPVVPSLGAALVYSGGGPEELMALHYDDAVAHRYIDLRPGYGWGYRVGFRPAPYNYFTSYRALQDAIAAAPDADQPANVPAWDFLPSTVTDPLAGGFAASAPATTISVPYRALFGVRYQYNEAARAYTRFDDGVREVDAANGEVIAAKNVVIIQTEVHFTDAFGLDPAGNPKLDMVLTGTGQASVFRDGRRMDVTWTRPDIFDVFTLTNAAGEAVRLTPGQTWIHIVPKDWTIPSQ